jgi:hypothetical protein
MGVQKFVMAPIGHLNRLKPANVARVAADCPGCHTGFNANASASGDSATILRLEGTPTRSVWLAPLRAEQVQRARWQGRTLRIDFGLEYFVASDLRDNINNAANAGQTRLADFFHQLLRRVEWHATQHYEQFVKVIMAWEGDIKDDLIKALPTERKPTSLSEIEIKKGIGALVADWVVELDFRMKRESVEWENSDYPKIQAQMQSYPGVSVFMPRPFSVPPKPQSPAARRKITFPPCRP